MFLNLLSANVASFLKFWGDGSDQAKSLVEEALKHVRTTDNFNWTFIFILAVVFYIYWSEMHKKRYDIVFAGLALYGVHWLYEIMNAIICKVSGYPLWTVLGGPVDPATGMGGSSTFVLLIGVSWELSMMFSIAGIISFKMMPQDRNKRYFARGKFKGISCKLMVAIEMALLFALFESFLAATSNGSFVWVYKWWGVIPVFFTTYIPFFLASNYVPDMKPKVRNIFLISEWALVAVLLAVLIPLQVI